MADKDAARVVNIGPAKSRELCSGVCACFWRLAGSELDKEFLELLRHIQPSLKVCKKVFLKNQLSD